MLTNAFRAHFAELGIVAAQGLEGLGWLKTHFRENQSELPDHAIAVIKALISQAESIAEQVEALEKRILDWLRSNDATRRLASTPGVGPITASAIAANVRDPCLFRSARQFAAWLGLRPRANSSGGKDRQTGIRKQGHGDIRRPLVSGATVVLRIVRQDDPGKAWMLGLKARKRPKVVAVALANKTARMAWAILHRKEVHAGPTT